MRRTTVLLGVMLCSLSPWRSDHEDNDAVASAKTVATRTLPRLPLRFEANDGQWDSRVRFVARTRGTTLFITDDGMTLELGEMRLPRRVPGATRVDAHGLRRQALAGERRAAVAMKPVGVRPSAPVGEGALPTRSNFFLGRDPNEWRTNVANFARVRAKEWLPGVDVVWHAGPGGLEYDLTVASATDASKIAFEIDGADALHVTDDGSLEIATSAGPLLQKPPRVVQAGKELPARYRVDDARRVSVDIEGYDSRRPVLIDPVLVYSTYLGGSGAEDAVYSGIAVDAAGSAYVTGNTSSVDFPTTVGAFDKTLAGSPNVFVSKLSPDGSSLVYSTYLGGNTYDFSYGIAVDSSGKAYVVGGTQSTNFPTTSGAFQPAYAGGSWEDAFVTKLDPAGSALVYSTYLGGTTIDEAYGVAIDSSGSAYVVGVTQSTNFPTTAGAFQTSGGGTAYDTFLTKLNPAGTALDYSTYVGGGVGASGEAIAVDGSGNAYIAGGTQATAFPTTAGAFQTSGGGTWEDAFVTKMNATGTALVYSTYLGGSGADNAKGITLDSSGHAYVTGDTGSNDFPTTAGAFRTTNGGKSDAFVTKLDPVGGALTYSTYFGGSNSDYPRAIAVVASGAAYIVGETYSTDLPTTQDAFQAKGGGTTYDGFVTKLDPAGSTLMYSTYFGGSDNEYVGGVAVDITGSGYVVGETYSTDFPTTAGAVQTAAGGNHDAFVAKFGDAPLVVTPATATVTPKGAQVFSASGGTGTGYVWSLSTNNSGGSVASDGAYTAGGTGGVTDTVQVIDSGGNSGTATVTVTPATSSDAGSADGGGTLDAAADGGGAPGGSGGCGCTVVGDTSREGLLPLAIAVALALLRRRRSPWDPTPSTSHGSGSSGGIENIHLLLPNGRGGGRTGSGARGACDRSK